MSEELARAAEMLRGADKVMVSCHLGPDGDAMGSMLALASLLRGQGKKVTLYNPDLVPRHLKWLPGAKAVLHRLAPGDRFGLTCVVDCGDAKLLGPSFPDPSITGPIVALDHHESGRPFGDVMLCDPRAAAVGVLVARLAAHLGWPIGHDAAVALYVSLVSDTGFFRYSNTDAEALALASRLVADCGVEPALIAERMTEDVPLSRYKLLSAALAGLELAVGGAVSFMTVTAKMIEDAGGTWDDSEGVANYARALRGVECGVLLTPAKRGGTRVSLRSRGRKIDAGKICLELGGGGHRGAAGCVVAMDLADARQMIEERLAAELGAPMSTEAGVSSPAIDGVVVVDKPSGMTSADVVARVKRALGGIKVGHTGTLDPMATGVLPLCLGEATKLAGVLTAEDKAYDGELELGAETDTLDADGRVVRERRAEAAAIDEATLRAAMAGFLGVQTQVPPMYSAIKLGGRRLHELARAGTEVERPPRAIRIDRFELHGFAPPRARFAVECAKGTYVRSLVADLGERLGCGAHLTALRRTRSGHFGLAEAITLDGITRERIVPHLIDLARATAALPAARLDAVAAVAAGQGKSMRWHDISSDPAPTGQARLVDTAGRLVALVHVEGGRVIYDRVMRMA